MGFTNRIRLPFKLTRPQFPEDKSVYRKSNGETKTLSVVVKKTYEGETDWMPEKWHERLTIALAHDNITYEGDKYLGGISKDGDYEIDWQPFLDYPTAKAKFSVQVTPFDNSNSNCQTCEEATQLSLVDDTFPDNLEEDQSYTLNVYQNDNICCYPAVFSITTYDSAYLTSATIDQNGVLSIHTKSSFLTANGIKLGTYRVTCPNGSFDEADVYADLTGDAPGCLAPSNLRVVSRTTTTADFAFTEPSPVANHYIYRLYKASAPGVLVQTGTCGSSFHIIGLLAGVAYIMYVRSQCGPGDDDATASNFISVSFSTNPETDLCGQYILKYDNPFTTTSDRVAVTYLDCNGNNNSTNVFNHTPRTICAAQTGPGIPVSIDPPSIPVTASFFVTHGDDSAC